MLVPPKNRFDGMFERLIFLLAGSSLEQLILEQPATFARFDEAEGTLVGVVANRRLSGQPDRVELWVAGGRKRSKPSKGWLARLKKVLCEELLVDEVSSRRAEEAAPSSPLLFRRRTRSGSRGMARRKVAFLLSFCSASMDVTPASPAAQRSGIETGFQKPRSVSEVSSRRGAAMRLLPDALQACRRARARAAARCWRSERGGRGLSLEKKRAASALSRLEAQACCPSKASALFVSDAPASAQQHLPRFLDITTPS